MRSYVPSRDLPRRNLPRPLESTAGRSNPRIFFVPFLAFALYN
ncbi:MAG: hypothetical protein BLITH_0902 [Brockia lithotrophica]|uniref:Uncharacterized protein n=1 Tax=Brockia lithotrophica TaxID=933949 RepID=A0A2T5G964_9BACL|nr:MAG: hypothetical protein BLITH_0902 [Brockia lithotrophica]